MKLDNIDQLIRGAGDVTLGRVGPVECAAIACEGKNPLAMLVRRNGESLAALLERLDAAIAAAWQDEVSIDEINVGFRHSSSQERRVPRPNRGS